MTNNTDYIFQCKNCEHQLYIEKLKFDKTDINDIPCPACGEEPPYIWIYNGEGSYDNDYDKKDLIVVDIFTPSQIISINHKQAKDVLDGRDDYILLPNIKGFPLLPILTDADRNDINEIQSRLDLFFTDSEANE